MDTGIIFISNKFRMRQRLALWCYVLLLAFLWGCDSGGSCGGATEEVTVDDSAPEGTTFTVGFLKKVDVEVGGCIGLAQLVVNSEATGDPVFATYVEGDTDISDVRADRSEEATFVYFPDESDKSGLGSALYLSFPCTEDAAAVLVCPGAASLDAVTEGCPDSVTLTSDEMEVGNYWWGVYYFGTEEDDCVIGVDIENLGNGFGAKAL